MIFIIAGLSGVGKTTIARKVAKDIQMPLRISCTTRPIRPNEKDGVDYHFISDETYKTLSQEDKLIAKEKFCVHGTTDKEIWKYGFLKKDLKIDNCLAVINPNGIEDLKLNGFKEEIISILINIEEDERIKRILLRNDNQKPEEIKRRTLKDSEMFKNYKFDYIVENDNLEECVSKVINIIEKEKRKEDKRKLAAWLSSKM